jgi:hypothetical protein
MCCVHTPHLVLENTEWGVENFISSGSNEAMPVAIFQHGATGDCTSRTSTPPGNNQMPSHFLVGCYQRRPSREWRQSEAQTSIPSQQLMKSQASPLNGVS